MSESLDPVPPATSRKLPRLRFSLRTLVILVLLAGSILLLRNDWPVWTETRIENGYVNAVTWSSDEKVIAAGFTDGSILLYHRLEGKRTRLSGHNGVITSLNFSPDDALLLSSCSDGSLRIWNWNETRCWRIIANNAPNEQITSTAFSGDGALIAATEQCHVISSADSDIRGSVRIFQNHDGKLLSEVKSDDLRDPDSICFSPDSSKVACLVWNNRSIQVIDLTGNKLLKQWYADGLTDWERQYVGGEPAPFFVSFAPDGRSLVTADDEFTIRQWSLDGAMLQQRSLPPGLHLLPLPVFGAGRAIPCVGYERWRDLETSTGVQISASPSGKYAAGKGLQDSGLYLYSRRRPEYWWGVAWLPEFWLAVLFAGALVWSVWRDRKRIA